MTEQEAIVNRIVQKTIDIHAPATRVWSILTEPAWIQQWMTDDEMNISSDWKPGSPIIIRGNLHGIPYENKGIILQWEPGRLFRHTHWSSLSQQPDLPENYATTTFILTPAAGSTTLSFTQVNVQPEVAWRHVNYYWGVALALIKKLSEC